MQIVLPADISERVTMPVMYASKTECVVTSLSKLIVGQSMKL